MSSVDLNFFCETARALGIPNHELRIKHMLVLNRHSAWYVCHGARIVCRHNGSGSCDDSQFEWPRRRAADLPDHRRCTDSPEFTRPGHYGTFVYRTFRSCSHLVRVYRDSQEVNVRCLPLPRSAIDQRQLALVCAGRRARRHYLPPELHELLAAEFL